jgi:hypothetical protein
MTNEIRATVFHTPGPWDAAAAFLIARPAACDI